MPPTIATNQPARPIFRDAVLAKYFGYLFDASSDTTILASGAVGRRILLQMSGEGDFAWMKTAALYDNGAAKVRFENTPTGEQFWSVPTYLTHLGSGKLPLIMNPPIYLRRNSVLAAVLDDRQLVAATNNVRIALHGLKLYDRPLLPPRQYAGIKFYRYVLNFTADDGGPGAVTASGTTWQTVRTDGDSDFEIYKMTLASDGPFLIQVQSDSDYWFSTQLRSELLGGSVIEHAPGPSGVGATGDFPFILPSARIVTSGGYIAANVTDASGGSNRIMVTFDGARLYPAGGIGRRREPEDDVVSQLAGESGLTIAEVEATVDRATGVTPGALVSHVARTAGVPVGEAVRRVARQLRDTRRTG